MHSRKMINRLLILVLICVATFPQLLNAQSRDIYDRYVSAYKAYQDSIAGKATQATIQARLADYKSAKAAYDKELKKSNAKALTETKDEGFSDLSLDFSGNLSVGPGNAGPRIASATSASPGMSRELQSLVSNLWSEKNRKSPDNAIAQLEAFAARNSKNQEGQRAKYELAKAFEWLKSDKLKAGKILQEIAVSPYAGPLAQVAQDRLKVYKAGTTFVQWKNVIITKNNEMNASYKKYLDTSWLAFPVKLTRYVGYVGKMLKFNGAKKDFKKFQLWHEDMAAKFSPPPEIAYDLFKVAYGKGDPEGMVRLIYTNSEAWFTRWKILNEAKESILVQYFIVTGDIFGYSLQGLLLRKAREGVKIRFMMDARGTKGFTRKLLGQDFVQELLQYPNVEVKVFNPVNQNIATLFLDLKKMVASNHDKIIVVDEKYAIVGGRNISKDYFVDEADHPTTYRDCDVLIESETVAKSLALAFDEEFSQLKSSNIFKDLWGNVDVMSVELDTAWLAMDIFIRTGILYNPESKTKRQAKALKKYNTELSEYKHMTYFDDFDMHKGSHEASMKIIDKHSYSGFRNDITDQLVKFIDGSRREIIIQNPYVVLTERAEAALKRAAKRGIRVIMHTNSPVNTDSLITQAMFYADWKRLLKEIPTLEIYVFFGKQKLHAKNFVFDGKLGIVGTYNMDYMSEEINSEVVAAIKSRSFAAELRDNIYSDMAKSKKYEIEILPNGEVKAVFGPDDLKGSKFWLIKTLSHLGFLKPLI